MKRFLCGLVLLCLLVGVAGSQEYTITDLGTLPGPGFVNSHALGINASGQVVGGALQAIGKLAYYHAFVWQNGQMTDLGEGGSSFATGINASGQVVGSVGLAHTAFLWQNGHRTDLGPGYATAINDLGQIAGSNNFGQAVIWQNGGVTVLGPGLATAINNFGQAAGLSNSHAALWSNGSMIDLGTLGGSSSMANGINATGIVVGSSAVAGDNTRHAFSWQNGMMIDLGAGEATAINGLGVIVGDNPLLDGGRGRALLWDNGTMIDLNSLILANSGWTLEYATALNDAGQIVGWGRVAGKPEDEAFLLTPTQAPVPEPATLLLLAIGKLGVVGWAWRRKGCSRDGEAR